MPLELELIMLLFSFLLIIGFWCLIFYLIIKLIIWILAEGVAQGIKKSGLIAKKKNAKE